MKNFVKIRHLIWVSILIMSPTIIFSQPYTDKIASLRVISFEGGWNLSVWVAQRQGFFKKNGVEITLTYTPNSVISMQGLMDSKYDIALASIDNLIAYQEGQGGIKINENPDMFAFMGVDNGFLSLIATPQIKTVAELKGKTLSVDAINTGFAFVLHELVARSGLKEGDVNYISIGSTADRYKSLLAYKQEGTLLKTPFSLLAESQGFNEIATAKSLGAYQGTVGIARRAWAKEHTAALVGFIRGYLAGLDWLYDPKNRAAAEALLVENIPDMTPALAIKAYERLLSTQDGLFRNAALDIDGIRTVIALREKYAIPHKKLSEPLNYIDLNYYQIAIGKVTK